MPVSTDTWVGAAGWLVCGAAEVLNSPLARGASGGGVNGVSVILATHKELGELVVLGVLCSLFKPVRQVAKSYASAKLAGLLGE